MFNGKVQVKDIVVLLVAMTILVLRYYHIDDGLTSALGPILGFYVGHRTSGNSTT